MYYTLENASLESGFQREGGIRHNPSLTKVIHFKELSLYKMSKI